MKDNNLEKEFVPYTESLALKEFGFDEECLGLWNLNNGKHEVNIIGTCKYSKDFKYRELIAPIYRQAFRWFRKKHKINSEITYLPNIEKYGIITSDMKIKPKDLSKGENFRRGALVTNNFVQYDTHEEAELACIQKLIEIVKNKENGN
jgi:hypothetical protein